MNEPAGLQLARARIAELRETGATPRRRTPLEVLAASPLSLRASVNAMCWQCFGGEGGENHVKNIRGCTAPDCALFRVRPYQEKPA